MSTDYMTVGTFTHLSLFVGRTTPCSEVYACSQQVALKCIEKRSIVKKEKVRLFGQPWPTG